MSSLGSLLHWFLKKSWNGALSLFWSPCHLHLYPTLISIQIQFHTFPDTPFSTPRHSSPTNRDHRHRIGDIVNDTVPYVSLLYRIQYDRALRCHMLRWRPVMSPHLPSSTRQPLSVPVPATAAEVYQTLSPTHLYLSTRKRKQLYLSPYKLFISRNYLFFPNHNYIYLIQTSPSEPNTISHSSLHLSYLLFILKNVVPTNPIQIGYAPNFNSNCGRTPPLAPLRPTRPSATTRFHTRYIPDTC